MACHLSVSPDGRLLQPLALQCLAHPSGLAVSPDEKAVYVCETMANRVLRFVQKPAGVFHFSVFHQFSGGLGCADHARMISVAAHTFQNGPAVANAHMAAVCAGRRA
jgi:sugar lactone lactonase YvrE